MTETKFYVVDVITEDGNQIGDSGVMTNREEALDLYSFYVATTRKMVTDNWKHGDATVRLICNGEVINHEVIPA